MDEFIDKLFLFISRQYVRFLAWIQNIYQSFERWNNSRLQNLNRRTLVILILGLAVIFTLYFIGFKPPVNFPSKQYITINEGESLTKISKDLEKLHIVRNAELLKAIIFLRGGQRSVHAGDYSFAKPVNMFAVARIITTGAYGLEPIKITIPEGATISDMAVIYSKKLFKFDPEKFFAKAISLEGFLYPDTYYFLPNVKEDEVITVMNDNFYAKIAPLDSEIKKSKYTLKQIITLASIIEKEAWKEKDRKLISGVLHNRLDKNMPLQVDATFIYTHNKGTYQITIAELKDKENPYNTYVHKGLPPGPIASVGLSSIKAALNPTPSKYIFYLADRRGNTYYSRTYAKHLINKRRYVDKKG